MRFTSKRIMTLIVMGALFAGILIFAGCEEEEEFLSRVEMSGEQAPQYEKLLDMEYWNKFMDMSYVTGMTIEGQDELMERMLDIMGYSNLVQKDVKATVADGRVKVASSIAYEGDEADDNIYALSTGLKPAKAKLLRGFDAEQALILIAAGNPKGSVDVLMKWFTESQSFSDYMDAIGDFANTMGETGFSSEFDMVFTMAKMTAKGYWYTAQEDYWPLIGEELVIALYENPDFIGWEDIDSSETYYEGSPVRPLIALALGEDGLTEKANDAAKHYIDMFTEMMGMYSYDEEPVERYKIETKSVKGGEINFVNFEDAFALAWMEHDGALFISDLQFLENLDNYFDSSRKAKNIPNVYGSFLSLNAGAIVENFYTPFEDDIQDEIDMMKDNGDEKMADMLGEIVGMLTPEGGLGIITLSQTVDGAATDYYLEAEQPAADLMLRGLTLFEAWAESMKEMASNEHNYVDEYLEFYGNEEMEGDEIEGSEMERNDDIEGPGDNDNDDDDDDDEDEEEGD